MISPRPLRTLSILLFATLLVHGSIRAEESNYQVIVSSENSLSYAIRDLHAGILMDAQLIGWAPNWGWVQQPSSTQKGAGDHLTIDAPFVFGSAPGSTVDIHLQASAPSKNSVAYAYTLKSDADVNLTMIAAQILASENQNARSLTLMSHGTPTEQTFPINSQDEVADVAKAVFHLESGDVTLDIDPPATVGLQKTGFRLELAAKTFKAGTTTTTVTYTFSKPVDFIASEEAMAKFTQKVAGADWFPWSANDHTTPSVFDMSDWLEKPAGGHGGVRSVGDHFQFEDGTSTKFWGTNIEYAQSAPEHDVADEVARRFARYGINAVRLHKFTGPLGWEGFGDPNDATQYDAAGLEKFDYFTSQLKGRGIYYGFSHTFNFQVRPGNKAQLLNYDEIQNALQGKTRGLINFSEDIQDLLIKSVVNILTHPNKYTGKIYAEDPALCYVELQNEDDIFWYQTADTYSKCPTYANRLQGHFNDWLKAHYKSQDALASAWTGALKADETLDAGNIELTLNPYDFTESFLSQQSAGSKQRMLDCAAFLHETQDKFYSKFAKAIRDTGYKGPLCGSPWQAPSMVPEYYNYLSDYQVGFIDRHNYFGGDDVFETMLDKPGSGYLSTGLQQIDDRPFGISEWITIYPLLYQADGPAILAAYGLGLQGWDSSFEFCSFNYYDNGSWFAPDAGSPPFKRWNVDSPVQIGQFPALARMIYRGDVHQGETISTRKTSLDEISHDHFSFVDSNEQSGDVKSFSGSCPISALAAGRCVIQFTEKPEPSTEPDMSKYQDGTVITSTTGQLKWDSANKGFFTINTDGTKAVVGFASGSAQKLGNVTITSHTPYASILLTALDQHATLETTKSALVTAVARAVSTGLTINLLNNHVLSPGSAPLVMEPVDVDMAFTGRSITSVNVLNQNGALTKKTLNVKNNAFHINTAEDQTLYYQVIFQ